MTEQPSDANFQREERYIVIKRKHLAQGAEAAIKRIANEHGRGTVECVVVESDRPEYEAVWRMIEARCTGMEGSDGAL